MKLSGVLAESLIDTTFMSIPLDDALSDFCTFMCEEDSSIFPIGDSIPSDSFSTDGDESTKTPLPAKKPIVIARVPLIIPKMKGFSIIPGSIRDDQVVESVANYHKIAEAWITAHVDFRMCTKHVSPESFQKHLTAPSGSGQLLFKPSISPIVKVASSPT